MARAKPPRGLARPAKTPPAVDRRPVTRAVHGVELTDDYAWLRAENWQAALRDPAVLPADIRAVLEAENAHATEALAPSRRLIARLTREMRGRIKEDDEGVPLPDGPYLYSSRYRTGGQYPIMCRRPRGGGEEEILLDGDVEGRGKAFFSIGTAIHSDDHTRLAWSADENGSEYYALRVRDLARAEDLADVVPDTSGDALFTPDGSALLYIRLDDNHRPLKVCRHDIGTPASEDRLVFEEADTSVFVDISRTTAGTIALITARANETSSIHALDLTDPHARPTLVTPREGEIKSFADYHPSYRGEPTLFIRTNAGDAEDFRIVTAPLATPGRAHWQDLVPHRPGVLILSITVLKRWLIRLERENALPRIVIRALDTGEEHTIAFDEEAYSLGVIDGFEFDTDVLRFVYSSMTTPQETFDYDMARRTRVLMKRQEVPSGHDPAAYVTRRVLAPAPDGEQVPVSVVYRRDTPLDGTAPTLLYGYGSYGMAMPAGFSTARLSLVDRGFVYAIAHIRGGMEKGYRWYRTGKREHKTNTFTDFIAAAEHLVASGFSARDRIVAQGGSAGGMLMGAVANMRPDLFAGIIAEVPFVDVVNTMLDDTLPLTPPEWLEWGDPIRDESAFRRMLAYSPYDNVRPQAYPAMLVLAGVSDPRVTYWEPAKWVAKLRRLKTNDTPLLFLTNMDAGHGGAAGRFDRLKETARTQAFAIRVVGAKVGV